MKKIALLLALSALAACSSPPKKEAPAPQAEAAPAPAAAPEQAPAANTNVPSIYFDFDKSIVKSEFQDAISQEADVLNANKGATVTLEGNCDERGSSEYNIGLGSRRAEAVKRQLQSAGIAASRIKTVSLGESQPRATCHDESCWKENRRVDFVQ